MYRFLRNNMLNGDEVRRFFESIMDLCIGAFSRYVFYALYGIIASYSLKHNFAFWITFFPQDLHKFLFSIHSILEESVSAIPIIVIVGFIIGLLVRRGAIWHSFVVYLGVILFDAFYYHFIINDIDFFYSTFFPVWAFLLRLIIWILLFIIMISVGLKIKNRSSSEPDE